MTSLETSRTLVLNVDDYDPTRYARSQILRHGGFDVVEVATGKDALDTALSARPALVVLDVNLPDMSGLEVCRTLKADPRTTTTPILHVSATFTGAAHTVRALNGGADAYLTEPVEPPVLLATVNALLRARRAEEALASALARERAAREQLEAASRAKDQFLATLSHELRAPLHAILGWARLLRSGSLDTERAAHALTVIERNTQQQTQLIDEMLEVSRIITGQLRLDVRPMDIVAVARVALDAVRPAAEAKGLSISLLPIHDAEVVFGDAARLQQVIWNLLSNAVKFTAPRGRIDVHIDATEHDVRVRVVDTGPGIPPDFLPYVFQRFRQADNSPARVHGGLGLGLAIVRHLVELHGGVVRADSAGLGHGATFTITLPRHGASESALAVMNAAATRPAPPAVLKGIRVLVVDDDPDTREVLSACLALCGATVGSADTTAAALEALARDCPHVVVSDIGMPGRDGYALIAAIRALTEREGGSVHAIAVTGYASARDEAEVLRAGYDVHLPKPVDPEVLATTIARVIREGTPA